MFKRPLSCKGKIVRNEYCISIGIIIMTIFPMFFLAIKHIEYQTYFSIFFLCLLYFYVAQSIKRARDIGRDGWDIISSGTFISLIVKKGKDETTSDDHLR